MVTQLYAEIIGGTYTGYMDIKTSVLWTVSAKRFRGVVFLNQRKKYEPDEIKRVREIKSTESKDLSAAAAMAAAGGLFFGPVGAVVGAIAGGNTKDEKFGIEFLDGAKVVVQISGAVGGGLEKAWRCLYLYARENGLIEVDF